MVSVGEPSGLPGYLQVNVLGPFAAVRSDGAVVALPRKAQALFFLLLTRRGRSIERRELAELLWSRSEPEQALHSLRQCLFVLRRSLPKNVRSLLVVDGESVQLAASPALQSDLEDFEHACRSEDADELRAARDLYRGEALAGLSFRKETALDSWFTTQRERLEAAHARAVRCLTHGPAAARPSQHRVAPRSTCPRDGLIPSQVFVSPPETSFGDMPANGLWAYALGEEVAVALERDRMLRVSFAENAGRQASHVAGYLVRGRVRARGPELRLVVYLTALPAGMCLWSEVFTSSQHGEGAAISNQIAARVAHAVRTAEARQHGSVELMPMCLQAARMSRQGRGGNEAALAILRGVLDRAPDLDIAHALVARCYHVQRIMGWRAPDDSALEEGIQHARQATIRGADNSDALWMAGLAFLNIDGDVDAQLAIERAMVCDPASTNARIASSFLYCQLGDAHRAIARIHEAETLNPADTTHHVLPSAMATAYFIAGDYVRANAACDVSLAQRPGYAAALRIKVATASLLGRRDDAAAAAQQLLTIEPNASVARMRDYWRWLSPNAPDALAAKLEGWRRAQMPE